MKIQKNLGVYLIYTDLFGTESEILSKELMVFMLEENTWYYPRSDQHFRDPVYGWIGPFPSPRKGELKSYNSVKYAIGISPDGFHGCFLEGPFSKLSTVMSIEGDKGQCIFRLHIDEAAQMIAKWQDVWKFMGIARRKK